MSNISPVWQRQVYLLFVCILCSLNVQAQEHSQYDRGTPPQHAAGITFGSYTSADIGIVNLANGGLSFRLPLGAVGGRGGVTLPITLSYISKVWSASQGVDLDKSVEPAVERKVVYASYAEAENTIDFYNRLGPGWTIGAQPFLRARTIGIGPIPNSCVPTSKLTKLTLILPDKGEIELRDDVTDGAPIGVPQNSGCLYRDGYRGSRWHAADGSGLIYISDVSNGPVQGFLAGVVITSDGTRYRFDDASGVPFPGALGVLRCNSITDRNGNVITISYPGNEVRYTDQLGRVTKIERDVPDPANPSINVDVLVTLPGYGGPRYYRVKLGPMNENYRADINPGLPVGTGKKDCEMVPHGYYLMPMGTQLFPNSWGKYAQLIDHEIIVRELVLPDGRALQFKYNEYGEVAEVQLPTGGKVQYDYGPTTLPTGNTFSWEKNSFQPNMQSDVDNIDRALVTRRTYPDGITLEATWTYTYGTGTEVTAHAAGTGQLMLRTKHYFLPGGRYVNLHQSEVPDGSGYVLWSTGIERRTETLNGSGTILSASEQDWTQRSPVVWTTGYPQEQPENDNRVNEERRILDTGQVARSTTTYDLFNNPTETSEFDFDGTLKRRTVTSYSSTNPVNGLNYANDSIRLLRLPLQQSIFDGGSVEQARTITEYDIYINDGGFHQPMHLYSLVSGHDSVNYGVAKTSRGNATRIGRWIKASNTYLFAYPRYDMLGNVVSTKDPRGFVTTVNFDDDFGDGSNPGTGPNNPATPTYALPTLITSPDPGNGSGSHTARSQYDLSTGLLTGFKDRNNVISQTIYNDPFNRPTLIKSALGVSGIENHAAMFYAPGTAFGITLARNDILTVKDQNTLDDAALRSWTVTDGFGRTKETWSRDPQGDVKVVTNYDALGRANQTSNPFRPSLGETAIYTTTIYDLAGRTTSVTTPDSALVSSGYSGNTVTATDQNNKKRKSVTDALGRLKEIYEDPLGVNYQTSYAYDALDNLTTVTQGTQTRTFAYDSLKRLTSATNPESGAVSYQYDNNGNLTQKTDARSIVTTYIYDALNRNTTVNYSDTSTNPDLTRIYDTATNGKGRLLESYAGGNETSGANVEHTKIVSYDALGRPLEQRHRFKTNSVWSAEYQVQRSYNRAGGVTSQIYPSGRTVNYGYDSAGRLLSFTGNLGDGTNRTYSTGILYSSLGGMTKEEFGTDTPLFNKSFYNSRGQLSEIRVSTSYTGTTDTTWNRGAIINHYSDGCWGMCGGSNSTTAMTDNNGNLRKQEVYIPLNDQLPTTSYTTWWQGYDYDSLNRLRWVEEKNPGLVWKQEFVYDRWGNRTIHQTNTWGTNIPKPNFGVNASNNRLTAPIGFTMTYDAAGNLTADTYTGAGLREYDAENKMTRAVGSSSQWQEYVYNADGQRTRRKVDGVTTWQVYGMDGELLAEYPASGAPSSPQKEYGYRNGQLLVTAAPPAGQRVNHALAANGGVATASSSFSLGYTANAANNGDRKGLHWGTGPLTGSGWHDATSGAYPDWLQIDFSGNRTIDEINVITVQDDYLNPVEPTESMTFASYGIIAFDVQYWTGSGWATVTGGAVSGNDKVWRKFTFTAVTTNKIKVVVNSSLANYSRVVELEAWGTVGGTGVELNWLVADQLGTPRMVFDKMGSLANTKRHDYLPFGEELLAGTGNRTPQQGYVADNVRQKFTRKERDNETGLDYFLARYNSSIQGRFTGVDPYNIVLEKQADEDSRGAGRQFLRYLGHPQNWNRYAYVANNPLKYIDPDGAEIRFGNADPSQQLTADEEAALRNAVATLRQQSAAANAFFSLYVQPSGQGPDLDIQVMADQLFDNLPEVSRNQNILGVTSPGMVDINPGNPNDVRSASTLMVIRQSAVNLRSENQDRQQGHETKLEGIMSHEIVHGAHITTDYNGFLQAHQDARRNNIPYRQRPNERIANTGSTVIAVEREIRRHITREQRNVRWRNP